MARAEQKKRKSDNGAPLGFEAKLWLAADKLRNNMDAAEYKHVVLGLIFLKYISDAFDELHEKLIAGKGEYEGASGPLPTKRRHPRPDFPYARQPTPALLWAAHDSERTLCSVLCRQRSPASRCCRSFSNANRHSENMPNWLKTMVLRDARSILR